ncbi:hypothetical protein SUGI_0358940 [Cryptomeria japonica]|nr:hypothetical protein SUGI_0358940 [Cryptomeria japonica]
MVNSDADVRWLRKSLKSYHALINSKHYRCKSSKGVRVQAECAGMPLALKRTRKSVEMHYCIQREREFLNDSVFDIQIISIHTVKSVRLERLIPPLGEKLSIEALQN